MPKVRSEEEELESDTRPFYEVQPGKVTLRDKSGIKTGYYRGARKFREEMSALDTQLPETASIGDLTSKEEVIARLQSIAERAAEDGDFQSEIRALRELAQLQGFDITQGIGDIKKVSHDHLLDFFRNVGIPRMRAYMIDILDAAPFKPIVAAIWNHEVPLEDAAQYCVESLRVAVAMKARVSLSSEERKRRKQDMEHRLRQHIPRKKKKYKRKRHVPTGRPPGRPRKNVQAQPSTLVS